MRVLPTRRTLLVGTFAACAFASSAFAHHGWSWAEEEQTEVRGEITEIYIGQPHPTLEVAAEDGNWIIELGNPRQTEASGIGEDSAAVGDEVVALGNRSSDPAERRLKAVRITVNDQTFDIYPERIRS